MVVVAYSFRSLSISALGHFICEGNMPAFLSGNPIYAKMSDWKMLYQWLTGKTQVIYNNIMSFEVNFDGLVGPTHNYAGLAHGNVHSVNNKNKPSNPCELALQGLDKMKLMYDLGI